VFNTSGRNEKLTRRSTRLSLAAIVAAQALASVAPAHAQAAGQNGGHACTIAALQGPQKVSEFYIDDVDHRLEIRLRDGRKVFLAGLEAPRGTPGNPGLAGVARIALSGWIAGGAVNAIIAPGEPDRWSRHSAHLFSTHAGGAADLHVAAHLLAAGWGRADPSTLQGDCLRWLYHQEAAARSGGLGLWADTFYRLVDADAPGDLGALAGRIIVLEGRVAGTGAGRTLTFVNLGPRHSQSPTLTLDRRTASALRALGHNPAELTGKRLRARGLLHALPAKARGGPRVEIQHAEAIEILTGPSPPPASAEN